MSEFFMIFDSLKSLGTYVFWAVLSTMVAEFVVRLLSRILQKRRGEELSPAAREKLKKRVLTAIVVLMCTSYFSGIFSRELNFYQLMGVNRDEVDASQLKTQYKNLARQLHPDKNIGAEEQAAEAFRRVRLAYETLRDERLRFGYDHLGPSYAEDCQRCRTNDDFRSHALMSAIPFYVIMSIFLWLFGTSVSQGHQRAVWMSLAVLGYVEYQVLLGSAPAVVTWLVPSFLPFEIVALVRGLFSSILASLSFMRFVLGWGEETPDERLRNMLAMQKDQTRMLFLLQSQVLNLERKLEVLIDEWPRQEAKQRLNKLVSDGNCARSPQTEDYIPYLRGLSKQMQAMVNAQVQGVSPAENAAAKKSQ